MDEIAADFRLDRPLEACEAADAGWLATERLTGRRVVIRALSRSSTDAALLHRFERDLRRLQTTPVPGIAGVVGQRTTAEWLIWIRPWLPGLTLQSALRQGPLSLQDTLFVGASVARALERLHQRGLHHRNLRPETIILGPERDVSLVEVGLSVVDGRALALDALSGELVRFISPEQSGLVSAQVDGRTDLFALGVILFEAATGQALFDGASVGEVLRQQLRGSEARVMRMGGLPRVVQEVLQRLMRQDPAHRYQRASAVAHDLEVLAAAFSRGEDASSFVIGTRDKRNTLTDPGFVARREEVDALERIVLSAASGSAMLAVVEAESGAGKTRLLEELVRRVALRDFRIIRVHGRRGSTQRPFELLDEVVDQVLREAGRDPSLRARLVSAAGEDRVDALEVFPQLGSVLGAAPSGSGRSEEATQLRGARATGTLLGAVGGPERPALLLLDDAHWSEDFTATALAALRERGRHTSAVVSLSSDALADGHALRQLRVDLHLQVPLLTADEVRSLAASMAGALPEEAAQLVVQLAGGNAFMASAVVRGLVESGALVPQEEGWGLDPDALAQVRSSTDAGALLSARLQLLAPHTLEILKVGAILGSTFSGTTAAALSGVDATLAHGALEDARRRHLVWPHTTSHRWAFVHERVREALLSSLPEERRRRLHREAAEHFSTAEHPVPFELAFHFAEAGDAAAAFPWALEAARTARKRHAMRVAEAHYRIAAAGSAGASAEVRRKLAEEWGDALMLLGHYPEATEQMELARTLAEDPVDQARIEGLLGELAFKRGDSGAAAAAIERALGRLDRYVPRSPLAVQLFVGWEVAVQVLHSAFPRLFLGTRGDAPEFVRLMARLLSRLAYVYFFDRGPAACLWAQLRETNLAERYRPTPELAQAWSEHAPAMSMLPLYRRALRYAERSLQLRRAFGDAWGEGQTLHFYGVALYAASRFRECVDRCRRAVHLLERTGDRWEVNIARANLALSLYRLGRLEEARREGERLVEAAREIGDSQSVRHGLGVWVKAGGEVPEALFREELERPGEDAQSFAVLLEAEGVRHLQLGALEEATRTLERADEVVRRASLRQEYVASILPNLATTLRRRVERESPYQRLRVARLTKQGWRAAHRGLRTARLFRNNLPHAAREVALWAALRGRPRTARRRIEESIEVARRLEMSHELALSLDARRRLARAWGWHITDDPGIDDALLEVPTGLKEDRPTLSVLDRFPRVLEAGRRIAVALTRQEVFDALTEAAKSVFRSEQVEVTDAAGNNVDAASTRSEAIAMALAENRVVTFEAGPQTVVCAPVFERGNGSAALVVVLPVSRTAVGVDEERVAAFLAALAGAALENAAGFAQVEALSQERARLYEQAQEALHARDEFLEVASHELKTPLTALKLRLDAVLRVASSTDPGEVVDREAVARSVTLAREHANRLARLIHHLLDASSGAAATPVLTREPADLSALVHEVVALARPEWLRAECEVRVHTPGPVTGEWDPRQLKELLQHLLGNALKYGAGAPVDLEVSEDLAVVQVTVRDRGIGIPKDAQDRIFQRFERAVSVDHYGGFGLGLWNARNIARAHGGALTVESVEGEGATFILTLPRSGADSLH